MAKSSSTKCFKKKPGTTNKGNEYEDLFSAFLASTLSTNDQIEDFHLSSNDANFGCFDDLVVNIQFKNSKTANYAVQIKHKNSSSKIPKESLVAAQGDFSLQKYFQSYQKLKKENKLQNDFNCILFTNGTFGLEKTTLTLEGRDIVVEVHKHVLQPEENLLNTSKCDYVYKFEFRDKDGLACQEFEDFSQHFFFFPNQKQLEDLKLSFFEKFESEYLSKEASDSYLEYIKKWSEAEGRKECLNKDTVRQKIGEILLNPHTIIYPKCSPCNNLEIIREISSLVDIIIFKGKPELDLRQFDLSLINEDKKNILEIGSKFQIMSANVNDVSKLEIQEVAIILWHMKKIPLIVDSDQKNSEKIYRAISMFEKNERRFILCGTEIDKTRFSKFKIFENLSDILNETNTYNKLLQHFEISFQGRSSVPLDESFCKSIEAEDLVTSSKLIKIGEEKEDLPKPYIEQFLPRMIVSWDFVNNPNIPSISIIACFQNALTSELDIKIIKIEEFLKKTESHCEKFVLVTGGPCSEQQFEEICKKCDKTCHLFKINNEKKLKWIRSNGSVSEIRKYREVGGTLKEVEMFGSSTQKVSIISAKPGAGKTVMLKNIKNNISCDYWVLHTNLCNHLDYFNNHHQTLSFYDYLLSNQAKSLEYSPLTLRVREVFDKKKKIIFLLDALDELPVTLVDVVTSRITELTNMGYTCWLTTRDYLQTTLEDKFNIFAFTISEMDKAQQVLYIRSQLENKHTPWEINKIIKKITEVIAFTKDVAFLGIPFRICILTDLFSKNPEKYKELNSRKFAITDMIRHFVNEKFRFYYENRGKLIAHGPSAIEVLEGNKRYRIEQYEALAVKTLLPIDVSKNFNFEEKLYDLKKSTDNVGMISKIHEKDNTAVFVHNIFGEYFVASWMSKNLPLVKSFSSFIFEEKYKTIRLMFDLIMAKNCPAHLAVLHKDLESLRQCQEDLTLKDKAGRNCLHLICSDGRKHPLLDSYEKEKGVWFLKGCQKVDLSIENNELFQCILQFLIKENKIDPYIRDKLFGLTAMEYADQSLSLWALELLAAKYTLELGSFKNFRDSYSVAYYCVKFNYRHLFQNLEHVPYIVDEESGNNLLHLSTMMEQSHFLEKIFANLLYVKKINDTNHMNHSIVGPLGFFYANLSVTCKRNALHLAVIMGSKELVRELVKRGADVNFPDSNGHTALHLATISGKSELAINLLDMGADVNCKDGGGETVLHWTTRSSNFTLVRGILERGADIYKNCSDESCLDIACSINNVKILDLIIKKGKPKILTLDDYKFDSLIFCLTHPVSMLNMVEYLFKNGIDIKRLNAYAKTNSYFLKAIILSNKVNEVQLLIKSGVDFNSRDENGMNSLHVAVRLKRIEIVKILLQNDFDVDEVEDQHLATSLIIAVSLKNNQIVKLLLDNQADVNRQDNKGRTALHFAAVNDTEILKSLLEKNANVHLKTYKGESPLHFAASVRNLEAVELLMQHGARIEEDHDGVSPNMILANPEPYLSKINKEIPSFQLSIPSLKTEFGVADISKGLNMRMDMRLRFTQRNE